MKSLSNNKQKYDRISSFLTSLDWKRMPIINQESIDISWRFVELIFVYPACTHRWRYSAKKQKFVLL